MGIDPLTLGALAVGGSAIGNLGAGAMNASAVRDTNAANIAFQQQTNAQNVELMQESWARDDSAVFRRAQDLQRSGLSKTLAAGSAAAASSPIKLEPPQMQANTSMGNAVGNMAGDLGQMPGRMMQLKIGQSQADLMNNQYNTESAKQENLQSATVKNYADAGLKGKMQQIAAQDVDTFVSSKGAFTRGQQSLSASAGRAGVNLVEKYGPEVADWIKKKIASSGPDTSDW